MNKKMGNNDVILRIKKWLLLLAIIISAGCSTDEPRLLSEQAGRDVIDLLLAGEFQSVHSEWFDEQLQESLSVAELGNTWGNQIEMSGDFVEVSSLDTSNQSENHSIVEAELEYTNVIFEIRMVFNNNNHLVGFSVSNGVINASLPDSLVEEEITVGAGTSYELNGTLTLPKISQEGLPAVVLVHGSGPSNQDSAAHAYKPFRDLAWGLAQQGIAVIRYDKRTYTYGAQIAQNLSNFTVYEETIEDAIRAAQLVREDNRIDENNVFILGHSLGGMLAPRIDMQGGDFAGIIIFAGSPRPLWEIIYDQNMAAIENNIFDESEKMEMKEFIDSELQRAKQLQDMTDEEAQKTTVFGLSAYYFREMDQFDVKSIVSELEKPLLIMQGETDFQVLYEKDFALWKELLKCHENATFISYPNLNHFFVHYQGPAQGTIEEYSIPGQVDANVIDDIGKWILEQIN